MGFASFFNGFFIFYSNSSSLGGKSFIEIHIIHLKKNGTKSGSNIVANIIPPTTAQPNTLRLAAPAPLLNASGIVPKIKASDVIIIGLNLS